MADIVVRVDNLTKKYGKYEALSHVSLSLEKGKIYGFIGKNGAGKTTMINHINGLLFQDEGTIELFGSTNEKELISARKRIGTVSEHAGLHPNYNARDNIILNMKLRGISNPALIDETINNVGLMGVGKKKFKNYSMGMKQRLAIGCAMLSGPELLLMDEPINGLDPVGIVEIRNLLKHLNKNFGVTILISSHILTELHELATDYIIIDQGKIVDQLTASELDARCDKKLYIRTDEVERVVNILKEQYRLQDVWLEGDSLVVPGKIDADAFAKVLFDERILMKEYYLKEDSLENYFINMIGGGTGV